MTELKESIEFQNACEELTRALEKYCSFDSDDLNRLCNDRDFYNFSSLVKWEPILTATSKRLKTTEESSYYEEYFKLAPKFIERLSTGIKDFFPNFEFEIRLSKVGDLNGYRKISLVTQKFGIRFVSEFHFCSSPICEEYLDGDYLDILPMCSSAIVAMKLITEKMIKDAKNSDLYPWTILEGEKK